MSRALSTKHQADAHDNDGGMLRADCICRSDSIYIQYILPEVCTYNWPAVHEVQ
jgi:hypothetical protein